MRKSTIPFLLISFLLVVSCGVNPIKGLPKVEADSKTVSNPYFSNPKTDYVYRAKISVYGHELGGILIAKKINDSVHRLVLTTDFGNKLIDVELGENSFKVNNIVDELNRKILINTLREDFRLLLKKEYAVSGEFIEGDNKVYQSIEANSFYHLFYTAKNSLYKLVKGSKRKQRITVLFTSENNIFADRVIIRHSNIKLEIELNTLAQ
jgi:phosphoribosylformylglycinamidine (FGAM) synthase PurS component